MGDPFQEVTGGVDVEAARAGERLDRFLATAQEGAESGQGPAAEPLSRSRLRALIEAGAVSVDGQTVWDPAYRVKPGERIVVDRPEPEAAHPAAENIPLDVVWEDAALIVIDKPAGLVVHPGAGNPSGTLVNALLAHCGESLSGIGGVRRPGIVHRLDKDTSGLLVVAKTDAAHHHLSAQFADHGRTGALERRYLALVWGMPERVRGSIVNLIDRSPRNRLKMAVSTGVGREAITHYEVVEELPGRDSRGVGGSRTRSRERAGAPAPIASLVECRLETGRTHQIRVHLAHIGYPVIGDELYGPGFRTKAEALGVAGRAAIEALGRQALHAAVLAFEHPVTAEVLRFESPLPPDIERVRAALSAL